jgi:hypothetical protein
MWEFLCRLKNISRKQREESALSTIEYNLTSLVGTLLILEVIEEKCLKADVCLYVFLADILVMG